MAHFVLYNSDGIIVGTAFCQTAGQVFVDTGLSILEADSGGIDASNSYITNGEVVAYSDTQLTTMANCPGTGWAWNPTGGWVDGRTLAQAQNQAQANLLTARDTLEYSQFTYNGNVYGCAQADQARINGAVTLALLAATQQQAFSIIWIAADGTNVTLDSTGMMGVGMACGTWVQSVFARYRTATAAISAATTNADCDAVTL
jgi:hypothetical protein